MMDVIFGPYRQKLGTREQDSILMQNVQMGVAVDFEKNEAHRKLRLILSEILFILSQIQVRRSSYFPTNIQVLNALYILIFINEFFSCLCRFMTVEQNII